MTDPSATAIKCRPLTMDESVSAILRGRKSMLRRVVTPQPHTSDGVYADLYDHGPEWAFWLPDNRMTEPRTWPCPWGQVGDRLWIRETWAIPRYLKIWTDDHDVCEGYDRSIKGLPLAGHRALIYAADHMHSDHGPGVLSVEDRGFSWRSPVLMPRWASRLTLEITAIRIERLQETSEDDAEAEGTEPDMVDSGGITPWGEWIDVPHYLPAFIHSWDRDYRNFDHPWESNPFVWCLTFKRID